MGTVKHSEWGWELQTAETAQPQSYFIKLFAGPGPGSSQHAIPNAVPWVQDL